MTKPSEPVTQSEHEERFSRILGEATSTLDEAGVPFAVFGGIAASVYGRPRPEHDIDLLVAQGDADHALESLERARFETEKTKPRWLYKAFKQDVMVDVIFRVKGDIYLDDELLARRRIEEYLGRKFPMVSPEDAVVIEAISHGDDRPEHWYNALAIVAEGALDWRYLGRRARHGVRRVLSLLVYAQSNDLVVPDELIRELFQDVYTGGARIDA